MLNTNFQTIHQMGQAINEVVRQATGRDAVQNIDMDHVTVAQNRYYERVTVSGSMVSFTDSVGNAPLEKCLAQIEPVQDLHGFDRPWAGGAGKNLLNTSDWDATLAPAIATNIYLTFAPNTVYTVSANVPDNSVAGGGLIYAMNSSGIPSYSTNAVYEGRPITLTTNQDGILRITYYNRGYITNWADWNIQIELGSSATSYEPYSNICPITGWTGANIHVSPTTDAQDGTTYSITFLAEAGTVYGGTLDVTNGTLTVTDGHIASYNGEILPGNWISDRDVYAEGTLPTTGAEVVYELDNLITYQFTPQEIRTLLGQNNIWADTGDIVVEYVNYEVLKELY